MIHRQIDKQEEELLQKHWQWLKETKTSHLAKHQRKPQTRKGKPAPDTAVPRSDMETLST